MQFERISFASDEMESEFNRLHRIAEGMVVPSLIDYACKHQGDTDRIQLDAKNLLRKMRKAQSKGVVNQFLAEYGLSSEEGIALLALAEAYLRVPDSLTANALISDKIGNSDWAQHKRNSSSVVVNSATWGLVLTKSLVAQTGTSGVVRSLIAKLGEPVVRVAVGRAMAMMGNIFVMGRTIDEAVARLARPELRGFTASFDMLGEAAKTRKDAQRYYEAYADAIRSVGRNPIAGNSVSIKLSALEPRYESSHQRKAIANLSEQLVALCELAASNNVGLTIDAEEADRLEMSLAIIGNAARSRSLQAWDGLGLAIQAYSKRARATIAWADALGSQTRRRISARLVKGAYWDTEIKHAQELGVVDFPVFTRKVTTDISYLCCAHQMLTSKNLYPAFATHNALTVATIRTWCGVRRDFEFQRLHGMGAGLYEKMVQSEGYACRVYAPVGQHEDLLAYLVRRLLENGANSSFVHQLADQNMSDAEILADPVEKLKNHSTYENEIVRKPSDIFQPERINSRGLDIHSQVELYRLSADVLRARQAPTPFLNSAVSVQVGLEQASEAFQSWKKTTPDYRAGCLDRLAILLEDERTALICLLVNEARKTLADAVSEVREAVDFCRYYAVRSRALQVETELAGPTGERNTHRYAPRGVWVAISPWNFPLAIFLGQIAAALVTGNTVVAKAAPQTPLIARFARSLAIKAGIPEETFQLVEGGAQTGQSLVEDPRVKGVVFTGSTGTARSIATRLLANPSRPLVPLIAETGGINVMIVDSTALPEQVVRDVVISAFQSAGQRCSALRLLVIQEDVQDTILKMLSGAMKELVLGDTAFPSTDVGPVIDQAAYDNLMTYRKSRKLDWIATCPDSAEPFVVPPTLIRNHTIEGLHKEWFGPLLHVTSWKAGSIQETVKRINSQGYGLTMGLHSRISDLADIVAEDAEVGNLYVNRSMIGAVVGSQPFGGEGLSGTGPKAGGPNYLQRFCTERVISIDTTSAGGNAALLAMDK